MMITVIITTAIRGENASVKPSKYKGYLECIYAFKISRGLRQIHDHWARKNYSSHRPIPIYKNLLLR